jgi:histidine triad (HIT) family protein
MIDPHCSFCRILTGESPAKILYRDDLVTAFDDLHPMAPVHLLIVTNRHIASVNDVTPADEPALGRMTFVARRLAQEHGVEHTGFRLVINTGPDASQSIYHLHMHLMGGKPLPFRMVGREF